MTFAPWSTAHRMPAGASVGPNWPVWIFTGRIFASGAIPMAWSGAPPFAAMIPATPVPWSTPSIWPLSSSPVIFTPGSTRPARSGCVAWVPVSMTATTTPAPVDSLCTSVMRSAARCHCRACTVSAWAGSAGNAAASPNPNAVADANAVNRRRLMPRLPRSRADLTGSHRPGVCRLPSGGADRGEPVRPRGHGGGTPRRRPAVARDPGRRRAARVPRLWQGHHRPARPHTVAAAPAAAKPGLAAQPRRGRDRGGHRLRPVHDAPEARRSAATRRRPRTAGRERPV